MVDVELKSSSNQGLLIKNNRKRKIFWSVMILEMQYRSFERRKIHYQSGSVCSQTKYSWDKAVVVVHVPGENKYNKKHFQKLHAAISLFLLFVFTSVIIMY